MPWFLKLEYQDEHGKHIETTTRPNSQDSIMIDYSGLRTALERGFDDIYMKAARDKADAVLTLAWVKSL